MSDGHVVAVESFSIRVDPIEGLFAFRFKNSELEALVQLGLLHLPELEELLLTRVDLIEKLHDMRD